MFCVVEVGGRRQRREAQVAEISGDREVRRTGRRYYEDN